MRLNISSSQLDRAHHQGLDRIGDIMRLIEHVCRAEVGHPAQFGVNQFVEDQEKLERFYRARIQIVIAVLAVVEMKPRKFAELDQAGDNHFNINVGSVVAEVDQAERLGPKLARAVVARPPIVDYRRVEGRLVEFVLQKHAPVFG